MARKKKPGTATDDVEKAATKTGAKLTPKVLEKALADLEGGAAGIKEMGLALGYKSGAPLRSALREAFGDAAYRKAIDAGRSARGVAVIGLASKAKATKPSKKVGARKATRRAKKS